MTELDAGRSLQARALALVALVLAVRMAVDWEALGQDWPRSSGARSVLFFVFPLYKLSTVQAILDPLRGVVVALATVVLFTRRPEIGPRWQRHWVALTVALGVCVSLYLQMSPVQDHEHHLSWLLCIPVTFAAFGLRRSGLVSTRSLAWLTVCSVYGYAGISKVVASGFAWADGNTLRLLAHAFGRDGALRDALVSHGWLACAGQVAALTLELSALVAWVHRWSRVAFALGLAAFSLLNTLLFPHINFLHDALLVAVFFAFSDRTLSEIEERWRALPWLGKAGLIVASWGLLEFGVSSALSVMP